MPVFRQSKPAAAMPGQTSGRAPMGATAHILLIAMTVTNTGCFTALGGLLGNGPAAGRVEWEKCDLRLEPPARGETVAIRWAGDDHRTHRAVGVYEGVRNGLVRVWTQSIVACETPVDVTQTADERADRTACTLPLTRVLDVHAGRTRALSGAEAGMILGAVIDAVLIGGFVSILYGLAHSMD